MFKPNYDEAYAKWAREFQEELDHNRVKALREEVRVRVKTLRERFKDYFKK